MLYLVPTPIGNLGDITLRALEVLRTADRIWAEDTRVTGRLLKHYGIETPLGPFHAFNEHQTTAQLVDQLRSGAVFALVSDAGTPGISDPGFLLVRACRQADVPVTCLPGATAFVPAIAASGLPSDKFHFEGFLPHKKGRQTRLRYLATLPHTFILYESPNRLVRCLEQLSDCCGPDRPACVARELSKIHETIRTDTLANLVVHFREKGVKGEICVVVSGLHSATKTDDAYDKP
ncbi:MAG: hypothetical protein RLY31_2142 [Bacteroidota bacterium]|jgi:16S rRNA (cytidine1402-2'-O)-methyltransferase